MACNNTQSDTPACRSRKLTGIRWYSLSQGVAARSKVQIPSQSAILMCNSRRVYLYVAKLKGRTLSKRWAARDQANGMVNYLWVAHLIRRFDAFYLSLTYWVLQNTFIKILELRHSVYLKIKKWADSITYLQLQPLVCSQGWGSND